MKAYITNMFLILVCFVAPVSSVLAEENNAAIKNMEAFEFEAVVQQEAMEQKTRDVSELQLTLIENNRNYVIITAVLFAFTLVVTAYLMKITPHRAKDLVTIIGLVSVIFGTILLVLIVDTTETLTAPMGIMGAIAGYLFGAAQKRDTAND